LVGMHVCMYVCMYVCTYVYVHMSNIGQFSQYKKKAAGFKSEPH
jgi:hypothetical protein